MESYSNEYLKKCELNNIDLWSIDLYELQQSIEENALVIVSFLGDATIIMTKNEIYVEDWDQGDFPYIVCFQRWENSDEYQIRDCVELEQNTYSDINYNTCIAKMMKRLFEKCKYTLTYDTKENIIEEINSRYL